MRQEAEKVKANANKGMKWWRIEKNMFIMIDPSKMNEKVKAF